MNGVVVWLLANNKETIPLTTHWAKTRTRGINIYYYIVRSTRQLGNAAIRNRNLGNFRFRKQNATPTTVGGYFAQYLSARYNIAYRRSPVAQRRMTMMRILHTHYYYYRFTYTGWLPRVFTVTTNGGRVEVNGRMALDAYSHQRVMTTSTDYRRYR